MMNRLSFLCGFIALNFFMSGCSMAVARYSPSTDAQIALRDAKEKSAASVSVGDFQISGISLTNNSRVSCRSALIVPPADKKTFTNYIRSALIDELRISRLYDENSKVVVSGNLSQLQVSSSGTSSWKLTVVFSVGDVDKVSFTSNVDHEYVSSFDANSACQSAIQAFPVAVQRLISDFVQSKEFLDAIGK
jgi:hypothetical protein